MACPISNAAALPLEHPSQKEVKSVSRQELWKKFFVHPSDWWDNRFNKDNPKLSDFVHKTTKQALWFDPWRDPPWVALQLTALDEKSSSSSVKSTRLSSVQKGKTNDSMARANVALGSLKNLCEEGKLDEALHVVDLAQQAGYRISSSIFYRLLQECMKKGNIASAKVLHLLIIKGGFEKDVFLGNHLIHMFALFGSLTDVQLVFRKLSNPDAFVWSAIILAHSKLGQSEHGVDLYCQMQQSNVVPDGHVFLAGLKACSSAINLTHGKLIHNHILEAGMDSEVVIVNALIDMYAKCGSLEDGQRAFDKLQSRDVISWSSLIAGYAEHGFFRVATELLHQMQNEGIKPNAVTINAVICCFSRHGQCRPAFQLFLQMPLEPDSVTFMSLLKACTVVKAVKEVHAHIVDSTFQHDVLVGNTLIDMYAKFGALQDAYTVFKNLKCQNMVSWNVLISGYAQNGYVHEADCLFQQMQKEGVELDNVAWNALIAGYALNGYSYKAFKLFQQMDSLCMKPDSITFLSILKAWSVFTRSENVCLIHSLILEWELHVDVMVANTLIDVYCKCGSIDDARRVFDTVSFKHNAVTWNAMIIGYAQHCLGQEAFDLFTKMGCMGVEPDKFTYASILKAVSSILALDHGKLVHDQVIKSGFQGDVFVWSSLMDMYVKCGSHEDAQRLFLQTCGRDIVMWNALISGHAHNNDYNLALHYFQDMQQGDCGLDDVTYVGLLSACGRSGLVEESCSHFKAMIESHAIAPTFDHYNCLVDSLGRSGCLDEALSLLESMPFEHNLPGWTALLGHCRAHGKVEIGEKCHELVCV